MPDSKRLPIAVPDEAGARDRQIDTLLEDGLDRYFNGRYEDAIHLWTRVLFLDRSHARARAYIDRARTALAELQRRSEELLQASRDLLDQGQTEAARQLLTEAIAASGDDVQAAAVRARLERLERARALVAEPEAPAHAYVESVPGWSWRRRSPAVVATTAAVLVVAALAAVAWLASPDAELAVPALRPTAADLRPSGLSSSEVALVRARTLFARGRLSEALRQLDRVAPEHPDRQAADQLRIEIQQLLLASVQSSSGSASVEALRR